MRHSGTTTNWRIYRPTGKARLNRGDTAAPKPAAETDAFLWSLADLMTLLLIFFIMLYSNAIQRTPTPAAIPQTVNPPEEVMADAPDAAGDVFGVFPDSSTTMPVLPADDGDARARQPDPPPSTAPAAKANPTAEPVNRQMLANLADDFNKDFYVRWEDRQPIIVLGERITFNVGEAHLLPEAHDALKRVARMISRLNGCRVVVSGHTDDLPIRTPAFPSNWELSAARAASVAKALMDDGVAPQRLTIQGLSQFKPLYANTSAENRRANRRVEISLLTTGRQPITPK
jgi:chemotaxis protein MotB